MCVALVMAGVAMAAECVIVPLPVSYEAQKGKCTLSSKTVVYVAEKSLVRPATMFCANVAAEKGLQLSVAEGVAPSKGAIALSIDKSLAEEAYTLVIAKSGVTIKGGSEKAVFYGLQSLRQVIFHAKGGKSVKVDCMTVKDQPHFGYRGGMLDVCRHIFSVDEVKKFIDILAMHKMNRFHWHLTEDQGWRIEIKKYPNLTKVGSTRKETLIGRYSKKETPKYDGKPYGGYFTQDEVREIVRYAAERYIEVIPEIDMPGHMVAALASYPHLGCRNEKFEVRTTWGISKDVLCPGKETTFEFVEGVLEEIVKLFPSQYIHYGGDETPRDRWKECPHCQKRIKEEGLKDENELQSYFMHRVEKFLAKHNRKVIGWDEIIYGGINKSATIMLWNDRNRAKAISLGNDVILTPKYYCYMDYYQTKRPLSNKEGLMINESRLLTLRKAYSLDPFEGLQPSEYGRIKGVQANLWTEYVPNFQEVQTNLLPRMAAIAEVGWTSGERNFDEFGVRMHHLRKLYDKNGISYAPYFFDGVDEIE